MIRCKLDHSSNNICGVENHPPAVCSVMKSTAPFSSLLGLVLLGLLWICVASSWLEPFTVWLHMYGAVLCQYLFYNADPIGWATTKAFLSARTRGQATTGYNVFDKGTYSHTHCPANS